MTIPRAVMSIAVGLLIASGANAAGKAKGADVAPGALSHLLAERCWGKATEEKPGIEWPSVVYERGKAPTWGPRVATECAMSTVALVKALGAGALWTQMDHAEITADPLKTLLDLEQGRSAFKKAFGWDPPDRAALGASGFPTYKKKNLKALFKRLYLKPNAELGGVSTQQIYDVMFKKGVTAFAKDAAHIKEKIPKKRLTDLTKAYQAAAKEQGDGFRGPGYLFELGQTEFPEDAEYGIVRGGHSLGIILRRSADGTWPTLVKLLKKVLKDYDPELSKQLGKKL